MYVCENYKAKIMKLLLLFTVLSLSFFSSSQSDSTFVPGYYVVNSNAEYNIIYQECRDKSFEILDIDQFPYVYEGPIRDDQKLFVPEVDQAQDVDDLSYLITFYEMSIGDLNDRVNVGEVVLAYELTNGKYHCFRPDGKKLILKGENCISKVKKGAGIGNVLEDIIFIDGNVIDKDSFYWMISQNIINSTVTVQIEDGKTIEIPQSKIHFSEMLFKRSIENAEFEKVGTEKKYKG